MTAGADSQSRALQNNMHVNAIKNWLLKQAFLWCECPFCEFFWPQTDEGLLSKKCTCYHPSAVPNIFGVSEN